MVHTFCKGENANDRLSNLAFCKCDLICHPLNASELEGLLMTAKTPKSSWHRCFLCGYRNLLRVKECVSTASARGTQTLEWAESCSKLDPNT